MNAFLETSHKALEAIGKFKCVYVVMGNDACDLDSAISSLVYAYFLHKTNSCPCKDEEIIAIPVLNIKQEEFPLRTETKYFLDKNNITLGNLTFRDQINFDAINSELKLTLVDHHVVPAKDSALVDYVVEVIDHRPVDNGVDWSRVQTTIEPVGSCATLISKILLEKQPDVIDDLVASLLRATIVLDTVNFNVEADRFKKLDADMVNVLESKFNVKETREKVYNELTSARSDVSSLTPLQVLHRDMKIINGLPFPGVPMLLDDFVKLPGARDSFADFCRMHNVNVIVPMGLVTMGNVVLRDIAVFTMQECAFKNDIIRELRAAVDLGLSEAETNIDGLDLFKQNNVKMSRKQIVPLLKNVIELYKDGNRL